MDLYILIRVPKVRHYDNKKSVIKACARLLEVMNRHKIGGTKFDCVERILLMALVHLCWFYSEKNFMKVIHEKIMDVQNMINSHPTNKLMNRWIQFHNTASKIEKIILRRADTLADEAATKIQRVWRAHAYNPDRSAFGLNLARREFDLCKIKLNA
jgi:hypothetical protein